jgi:hypothetical protein
MTFFPGDRDLHYSPFKRNYVGGESKRKKKRLGEEEIRNLSQIQHRHVLKAFAQVERQRLSCLQMVWGQVRDKAPWAEQLGRYDARMSACALHLRCTLFYALEYLLLFLNRIGRCFGNSQILYKSCF